MKEKQKWDMEKLMMLESGLKQRISELEAEVERLKIELRIAKGELRYGDDGKLERVWKPSS